MTIGRARHQPKVDCLAEPGRRVRAGMFGAVSAALTLMSAPAAAQFSAREGFTADGAMQFSVEVSPYPYLPNVSANIGLYHPAGFDVSVNQNRPTVSKLLSVLQGPFLGDSIVRYRIVRYGNYSDEINIMYVAAEIHKTLRPILPGGPGATLKSTVSGVVVSPGFGYQMLATDAVSQLALDVRAGFTYSEISAGASFDRSLQGGVNTSNSFVQHALVPGSPTFRPPIGASQVRQL